MRAARVSRREPELTGLPGYLVELFEALRPVAGRLDASLVSPDSGLQDNEGVVELTVQPRGNRSPALHLHAAARDCTLIVGEGEVLQWHGPPQETEGLVADVLELVARFLSGVTVVERYNRFNQLLRTEYYYGPDEEPNPACAFGHSSYPLVFPRGVHRTVKRHFRFLQAE
jgi:hypothetical protein